jgi:hypothetical protein
LTTGALAASCGESQLSDPDGPMNPNDVTLVDQIVFTKTVPTTLAANLYVLSPKHKDPIQLTFFPENVENRFFTFTPGGWAIYQHGDAIMAVPVANAAPETTVVLADAALYPKPLAVSSDDRVVFEVANGLRTARADGTETRVLATTAVKFHGITPDDRIIFSDLYVLYAIPASASTPSEAVKLDESKNAAYEHHVSMSGQAVAFAKADVLGLVDLSVDPPSRTVLASGGLFSSPTLRDQWVFYNWRPDESHWLDLWVIRHDGTGEVPLAAEDGPGEFFRALTADGRVIYERVVIQSDLHSVKLDGTDHVQIAPMPADFVAMTAGDHVVYNDDGLSGVIHSARTDGSDVRLLGTGEVSAVTDSGHVVIKPRQFLAQTVSVSVLSGAQVNLENLFQNKVGVTSNGRLILGGFPSDGGVQLYSISPSGSTRSWLPTRSAESPGGFDSFVRVVSRIP